MRAIAPGLYMRAAWSTPMPLVLRPALAPLRRTSVFRLLMFHAAAERPPRSPIAMQRFVVLFA